MPILQVKIWIFQIKVRRSQNVQLDESYGITIVMFGNIENVHSLRQNVVSYNDERMPSAQSCRCSLYKADRLSVVFLSALYQD